MLDWLVIVHLTSHRVGRTARFCVAQGLLAYEEQSVSPETSIRCRCFRGCCSR